MGQSLDAPVGPDETIHGRMYMGLRCGRAHGPVKRSPMDLSMGSPMARKHVRGQLPGHARGRPWLDPRVGAPMDPYRQARNGVYGLWVCPRQKKSTFVQS